MPQPPDAPAPPPTIAYLRDVNGVPGLLLSCLKCGVAQRLTWDDLELPDSTPFPRVRTSRPWQCQRCGGTKIAAMPDWGRAVPVGVVVDLQAEYRKKR